MGRLRTIVYVLLGASACTSIAASQTKRDVRKWTSLDGNFTMSAKLSSFGPEGIKLTKTDSTSLFVPLKKLSLDDQRYAIEQFATWESRPALGLTHSSISALRRTVKQMQGIEMPPLRTGVVVVDVLPDGPADIAGIKPFDAITHIADRSIYDTDQLFRVLMELECNTEYPVRLFRLANVNERPQFQQVKQTIELRRLHELLNLMERQAEQRIKDEQAQAKLSPLRIVAGCVSRNSIGTPELLLQVRNMRKSDAVAYTISAECYNNFDERIRRSVTGASDFSGIGQRTIEAGSQDVLSWTMHGFDHTTKAKVTVARVKLRDGTDWKKDENTSQTFLIKHSENGAMITASVISTQPSIPTQVAAVTPTSKPAPPNTPPRLQPQPQPNTGASPNNRTSWRNQTYKTTISIHNGVWTERETSTSKVKWSLVEKSRTANHIELFNAARNQTWRLTKSDMLLLENGKWRSIAKGNWE